MYCTACGAEAQAGQRYCSRCGRAFEATTSQIQVPHRVKDHVRPLGLLWLLYSGFAFLTGSALLVGSRAGYFQFWRYGDTPHPNFLRPLISLIAFLIIAKGVAGLVAGWGLLDRSSWARSLTIVLSFISLLNIPFGTALGIYSLWVLLSQNADREYKGLSYAG